MCLSRYLSESSDKKCQNAACCERRQPYTTDKRTRRGQTDVGPFGFLPPREGSSFPIRLAYIEEMIKFHRWRAQQSAYPSVNVDHGAREECKLREEGSITNSLSIHNAILEVDLGMKYVSSNPFRLLLPY